MRKLFIVVFLLIPILLFAQYSVDGRRIYKGTIDGTKFYEATNYIWFPVAVDSGVANLHGTGAWQLDTTYPPIDTTKTTAGTCAFRALGFLADSTTANDNKAYLTFVCPDDYKDDSMELYLYWYHTMGATADYIQWYGATQAITNGEALFAAGTAITGVQTACSTKNYCLITNLDPEVEELDPGDLIQIKIAVDNLNTGYANPTSGARAWLIGVLVEYEAKER
jgi:hypothetical protein